MQHDQDIRLVVRQQLLDGVLGNQHRQGAAGERELHELVEELEIPAVGLDAVLDPFRVDFRRILHRGRGIFAEDVDVMGLELAGMGDRQGRFNGPPRCPVSAPRIRHQENDSLHAELSLSRL